MTGDSNDQASERPNRFSGAKAKWILLTMTVFLLLAGAELYVRIFVEWGGKLQIGEGELKLDDRVVEAAFEGDTELFWRLQRNVSLPEKDEPLQGVIANGQGFRDENLVSLKKQPDEIRILFVGDSTTFGWRLRHDQTFARQVQDRLRARFPDLKISCLNAGVPAYTAYQGLRYLELEGFAYEPDLIVLGFGANAEYSWNGMSDFEWAEVYRSAEVPWVLRFSELAKYVWLSFNSQVEKPKYAARPRLDVGEFRDVLTRVANLASSEGTDLLVMSLPLARNFNGTVPPDKRDPYQFEVILFGETLALEPGRREALVDGIEVLQRLAKQRPNEPLFIDRAHPTASAASALAEALYGKIGPWVEYRLANRSKETSSAAPHPIFRARPDSSVRRTPHGWNPDRYRLIRGKRAVCRMIGTVRLCQCFR